MICYNSVGFFGGVPGKQRVYSSKTASMSSSFQSEVVSQAFSNSISIASWEGSASCVVDGPACSCAGEVSSVSIASDGVGGMDLEESDNGREFGRNVERVGCILSDRSIRWTHLRSRRSLCYCKGHPLAYSCYFGNANRCLTRSRSSSIRLTASFREA